MHLFKAMLHRPDLLLLVDYGDGVGMGHLMRCLTVVEWLSGVSPFRRFLLLTGSDLPKSLVHQCQGLGVEIFKLDDSISLAAQVEVIRPRLALVDGYTFGSGQLSLIASTGIPLALFDDLNDRGPLPATMVINPSPLARVGDYPGVGQVLAGCQFAPVRPEFRRQPFIPPSRRARALINCGGTDPLALSQPLSASVLQLAPGDFIIDVVTGGGCSHATAIAQWCDGQFRVRHHHAITNFASVGASARLAVVAVGNTLYELCALGTPVLGVAVAKNQQAAAEALAESGLIELFSAREPAAVGELFHRLWREPRVLDERAERQRQLIDGRGGERIARALLQLIA